MVCDASTLIALARIGRLDILKQVGVRVTIPTAVYEEIVVKGAGKPGADEVREASWIETREVADRSVVAKLRTALNTGESEAIALAKEIDADLIILDDQDARNAALSEGLNVVGLLALLVLAFVPLYLAQGERSMTGSLKLLPNGRSRWPRMA
jgi:predicted nucleic acid-binding protein